MMLKTRILALLFLLLIPLQALAEKGGAGSSREELFSLANLAYADGRYDEAMAAYRGVIEKGVSDPSVYYNLGNACARAGKGGEAILYYEKALELAPGDEDTLFNLALVRKGLKLEEDAASAPPWERLFAALSFTGTAALALFLYLITFALFAAARVVKDKGLKGRLRPASRALAVITLGAALTAAWVGYRQERACRGIVTAATAPLYELPLEQGEAAATVAEGTGFKLLDEDGGWYKIALPNGGVGWIKSESAGII